MTKAKIGFLKMACDWGNMSKAKCVSEAGTLHWYLIVRPLYITLGEYA